MKTHGAIVILLLISTIAPAQRALRPKTVIIEQSGSPVKISSYTAFYSPSSAYAREGVGHSLTYENQTDRLIVAIQITIVSFDVWNEYLDRFGGLTTEVLKPKGKGNSEWNQNSYADFSFHTGVAYVSRVRFDDGEIWKVDTKSVLAEMRKIEANFDAGNLEPKPSHDKRP